MAILDGNLYDTRSQEAGQELEDDLEASQLLLNNRQQPLLIAGGAGQHTSTGKVLVQLSVRPLPASWSWDSAQPTLPAHACLHNPACCRAVLGPLVLPAGARMRRVASTAMPEATARSQPGAEHTGKVGLRAQRGSALLPDLHVSDSSEAILSGRKPPFRLLVRAVASDGRIIRVRHAVSEGFVVRPPRCLAQLPALCVPRLCARGASWSILQQLSGNVSRCCPGCTDGNQPYKQNEPAKLAAPSVCRQQAKAHASPWA